MSEPVATSILFALIVLALLGAWDYIAESIRMLRSALKRHRERNRD